MTNDEKRIKIAQALGYREFTTHLNKDQLIWAMSQEEADTIRLGQFTWSLTPNYFGSRDAIMPAIIALVDYKVWDDFQYIVEDLVPWSNRAQGRRKSLLTAEAAILAEALGQHLNLWEAGE